MVISRDQALCRLFDREYNNVSVKKIKRKMRESMPGMDICYLLDPEVPMLLLKRDILKYSFTFTKYEKDEKDDQDTLFDEADAELLVLEQVDTATDGELGGIEEEKRGEKIIAEYYYDSNEDEDIKAEDKDMRDKEEDVQRNNSIVIFNDELDIFRNDVENQLLNLLYPEDAMLNKLDRELEKWEKYGFSIDESVLVCFSFARLFIAKSEYLDIHNYRDGNPLSYFGNIEGYLARKDIPLEKVNRSPNAATVEKYCYLPKESKDTLRPSLVIVVALLRSFRNPVEPHYGKTLLSLTFRGKAQYLEENDEEDSVGYIEFDSIVEDDEIQK